ncbi:MAG: hypothetical protein ACP5NZ_00190 [Nanobdellota archaeon]
MLNTNLATRETKNHRIMYLVGYTTYILSSNWRGNDLPIKMKGGEFNYF